MAAKIQESGEMYLETILILSKKKNVVRSIDIVEYMGFSKPSVSRAMARLREDKYIVMDADGFIALTEKGRALAGKIYERHTALTRFLVGIKRHAAEHGKAGKERPRGRGGTFDRCAAS